MLARWKVIFTRCVSHTLRSAREAKVFRHWQLLATPPPRRFFGSEQDLDRVLTATKPFRAGVARLCPVDGMQIDPAHLVNARDQAPCHPPPSLPKINKA